MVEDAASLVLSRAYESLSHLKVRRPKNASCRTMIASCRMYAQSIIYTQIRLIYMYDMTQSYGRLTFRMSYICMSHVSHMNESCRAYEWVVSHIWMSHVVHMNESCRTWICHVAHVNESCRTYEWVMLHECAMSHISMTYVAWMSHAFYLQPKLHAAQRLQVDIYTAMLIGINKSCRTYEWVMSHIWMSHVAHINE